MYGSDDAYGPDDSKVAAVAEIHSEWLRDWQFLVTSDVMQSPDFKQQFRGLKLPRKVVDQLYSRNARALFPSAWTARDPSGAAPRETRRDAATPQKRGFVRKTRVLDTC